MKVQEWLENQEEYNSKEKREKVTKINIEEKGLEGDLDLSKFPSLEEISCGRNKLTSLKVSNCPNIKKISAFKNQIKEIVVEELINLEELSVGDNKLEQLEVARNTKLRVLLCPGNSVANIRVGTTPYLSHYSGGKAVLSWEEINKKELERVAEELGIASETVQNKTLAEIKEEVSNKIEKVKASASQIEKLVTDNPDLTTNNVIDQAKINDLKNAIKKILDVTPPDPLPGIWKTDLEVKLNKLEKRPTQEQLNEAVRNKKKEFENHIDPNDLEQTAKDKLGMVSKADYEALKNQLDARPNITKEEWENDYSKRPQQTDLDKVQAELDKNKTDLGQANQKVQDYENSLKTELELDNNTLPNWKDEIAKLKKRPTSDNLDQVKNDLKTAQDNLKKWTEKTQGKTPDQVAEAIKKAETADNLQKELDKWKKLGETPEKVEDKIKGLESKPTGTTLTPEQQKLLNNITLDHYNTISDFMERQGLGINWRDEILGADWKAEVQQANK